MAIIGTNDTATVRVASLPSGAAFDTGANVTVTPPTGFSATTAQAFIDELTDGTVATNVNADLLDGVQGANYARTDVPETFNSAVQITYNDVNTLTLNKTNDSSLCGITFTVANLSNWMLYTSNAGNGDIFLQSRNYTTDGGFKAVIWSINWASGIQTFVQTPTVAGNAIWHAGSDVRHRSFTVGTAPSASSSGAGTMIYVSNESGGAVPAFSDGTNWRRVTDRAIIS